MFCLRKASTPMLLKSGITAIPRRPDTFPCFSPATMTRLAFRSSVDGYPASPPERTPPRCRESKYLGTAPQQPADEAGHKTQDNKQPWICAQHLYSFLCDTPFKVIGAITGHRSESQTGLPPSCPPFYLSQANRVAGSFLKCPLVYFLGFGSQRWRVDSGAGIR